MIKKIHFFLKLPVTLIEKKEAGYKEYFLEINIPDINSILEKLSNIYNPKIRGLSNEGKLNKGYLIFVNGRFTNDLLTEIHDNDHILIIPIVTGG
jgi:molybdopterin converting factor small subunit